MKIAIFSSFYPFRGGISQFSTHLFRSLEKNNSVKAFTFRNQYPKFLFPGKTQFVSDSDHVDDVCAERILDGLNPLTYSNGAGKIKEFQPDVLIVNHWMSFFGLLNRIIARKMNLATQKILLVHNLFPHEKRFFDQWMINRFIHCYDGFIAMSSQVAGQIKSIKPDAKILLLDHPLYDHFGEKKDKKSAREIMELHPNKKTLLFFGLIRDYKGLDLLIESMSYLGDDYQLVIAGEIYGDENKVFDLISKSKKGNNIHLFDRYVSNEEVSDFFSSADVCVLPYRSATQSGVTAVAIHFEVPLIVTPVGALPDAVEKDDLGVVAKKVDSESIADAIQAILNNYIGHY